MLKLVSMMVLFIQDREVALDFIGNRGTTTGLLVSAYPLCQEILQKEMLPHVSMAEGSSPKKRTSLDI